MPNGGAPARERGHREEMTDFINSVPVASKAKHFAAKRSEELATAVPSFPKGASEAPASIPCKAMPKKRQRGNNDPSPQDDAQARTPPISPAVTAETSICGKESCPTPASIPCKAMPDGLKRFRARSAGISPARISYPIDLEEEGQR